MDQATVDLGQVLVKTQDYYGWHVLPDDDLYQKFANEEKDVIKISEKEIRNIIKSLRNKRIAVEVGCHYGFTTAVLSKEFEQVHSFDFDNDVHRCFQMNVERHNLNNVSIHSHGLGDRERPVALKQDRGPLSLAVDPVKSELDESTTHYLRSLDSFKLPYCDLLCIDTEGYESRVLDGAVQTIRNHKPVIIAELHRKQLGLKFGVSNDTLHSKIVDLGYRWTGNITKHDRVYKPEA